MVLSSVLMPSSFQASTKFVPLSEQRSLAGPRMVKNLLSALMKLSVVMDSISSRWTALVDMQVKITAHCLHYLLLFSVS